MAKSNWVMFGLGKFNWVKSGQGQIGSSSQFGHNELWHGQIGQCGQGQIGHRILNIVKYGKVK